MLREVIAKATAANVTAMIILIAAVAYAIYYKDMELIKALALVGAGYLFGKKM